MTEDEFRTGKGPAFNQNDAYIAACDATCSVLWGGDQIQLAEFRADLNLYILMTQKMDRYKKVLFRGKSRADVGFAAFFPTDLTLADVIADEEIDLVHGIVGTITESGELAEVLMTLSGEGKADRVNVVEETGDITWYLSRILKWAGHTFNQCFKVNIDKLHGRHGAKFSLERDHNRDLQAERVNLENSVSGQPDLLSTLHTLGLDHLNKGNGRYSEDIPFVTREDIAKALPGLVEPYTGDMQDIADAEKRA